MREIKVSALLLCIHLRKHPAFLYFPISERTRMMSLIMNRFRSDFLIDSAERHLLVVTCKALGPDIHLDRVHLCKIIYLTTTLPSHFY